MCRFPKMKDRYAKLSFLKWETNEQTSLNEGLMCKFHEMEDQNAKPSGWGTEMQNFFKTGNWNAKLKKMKDRNMKQIKLMVLGPKDPSHHHVFPRSKSFSIPVLQTASCEGEQ